MTIQKNKLKAALKKESTYNLEQFHIALSDLYNWNEFKRLCKKSDKEMSTLITSIEKELDERKSREE